MTKTQGVLGGIAALVVILALSWIFTGNDFFLYKAFAPKTEAVRRDVFKQSQAYNDGMANQLADLRVAYATADSGHKPLLVSAIYSRFASYDATKLSADNQAFLAAVVRYETHQTTVLP